MTDSIGIRYSVTELECAAKQAGDVYHLDLMRWAAQELRRLSGIVDEAMWMLDGCVVSGGRLDIMCSQCGGDDGNLGGERNVTHKPDCRYLRLTAKAEGH